MVRSLHTDEEALNVEIKVLDPLEVILVHTDQLVLLLFKSEEKQSG